MRRLNFAWLVNFALFIRAWWDVNLALKDLSVLLASPIARGRLARQLRSYKYPHYQGTQFTHVIPLGSGVSTEVLVWNDYFKVDDYIVKLTSNSPHDDLADSIKVFKINNFNPNDYEASLGTCCFSLIGSQVRATDTLRRGTWITRGTLSMSFLEYMALKRDVLAAVQWLNNYVTVHTNAASLVAAGVSQENSGGSV